MHSLNNPSLLSQVLARSAPLAVPSGTCGGAVGVGADVSLGHAPANASDTCPDGQHAAPLRTYIVSAAGYELRLHPTTTVDDASPLWLELEVPLASFSGALPVLENNKGELTHSVLSTKRFLGDWAALSATARPDEGVFACPSVAVAAQCGGGGGACGAASGSPFRASAPNALLTINGGGASGFKRGIVVDIYDVAVRGDAAVLRLRWQRDPDMVPEASGCHAEQDMDPDHAHYHQLPGCGMRLADSLDGLLGDRRGADADDAEVVLFIKGNACAPDPTNGDCDATFSIVPVACPGYYSTPSAPCTCLSFSSVPRKRKTHWRSYAAFL